MNIQGNKFRDYIIEPEQAALYATTHMYTDIFTQTPGMKSWQGYKLGKITEIYDLSYQPLFYDFPVLSPQHEQVGMIRASASRILGVPILSTYLGGPRWNIGSATLWAHEFVENEFKGKIIDSRPICYEYPKLGIAVNWKDLKEQSQRSIIDVGDYSVIREKREPEKNGSGEKSFENNIPEELEQKAKKKFAFYDKIVDALQKRAGAKLVGPLELDQSYRVLTCLTELIHPFYKSKILTLCNHEYSHECFNLHGQEQSGYCTPATCQMILDFWRYYYSQSEIANAMNTYERVTPCSSYEMVTDSEDERTGLESLTNNQMEAEVDNDPTFDKVKKEINANRPFDYSFSVHSTACVGYSHCNFHIFGTIQEQEESVYLYDPWPVNSGTIRWETYDSNWTWICEGPDTTLELPSQLWQFVYLRRP